jgi:frataxin-like iron-binding protein CyaY
VAPSVTAATAAVPVGTERTFRLKVDGVDTTVTVDDLDAEFEIEFVDGVRTPMREEAKKEAQINLSKPMMELWATAQKSGPEAAFARVQMQTFVESFSLPKSWSPEALDKLVPPPSAKTEAPPEEDASLAGMPPAPAAKPRLVSATPDVAAVTASLQRAKAALESGDLPTAAKMLTPVAQMSPQIKAALDQAAAATGDGEPTASLLMVVNALIRGAPALAAQPQEQA